MKPALSLLWTLPALFALASCSQRASSQAVRFTPPRTTAVQQAMRRQAVQAADLGEGDLQLRALRQKVATNPADLDARLALARHYESTGIFELALEHLNAASQFAPARADLAVSRAQMLGALGLKTEAYALLENFSRVHPDAALVVARMAVLAEDAGNLAKAEEHWRSALRLEPASDRFHNNLGHILLLQRRNAEAATAFRNALERNPNSAIARNNLGLALAADPAQVLAVWKATMDPASAHNNLAALYMEQGRLDEARRELAVALGYRKDHPAVLRNLGLLSEMEQRPVALEIPPSAARRNRLGAFLRALIYEPRTERPAESARGPAN
jgi:Flp pilus assembly protein TadD